MARLLKVLSLGAGVQSSALLLMSCRGVLPRIDAAVFADTRFEPSGTGLARGASRESRVLIGEVSE